MSADRPRLPAVISDNPFGTAALTLALAAGTIVFVIAHELFPYHSLNHDEGVYLQQAAMLLDGRLFLTPDSPALRKAFHPWFFVAGDPGLYPKYSPVPAAIFALGKLAGGYRLALPAVAVANICLGYLLAATAFDRQTGLVAAAIMAGSPLFLIDSATFLPYAPTAALNLLFAVAYVRAVRRESPRYAMLAGFSIGLAFFSRPYTALLFAAPFVLHAIWRTGAAVSDDRDVIVTTSITAGVGLLFVLLTLGYNALTTGSAFLFPYQAFAPLDGLGFGRRVLLGYEVTYTPLLALRANGMVLAAFATSWFTAGLLGSLVALIGAGSVSRDVLDKGLTRGRPLGGRTLQLLLLGVIASVIVGNVAFWGNLNLLGRLDEPADGLISVLGPFYHFDLLLPMSAFAARGVMTIGDTARTIADASYSPSARVVFGLLLVLSLPLVGAFETAAVADPVTRNAEQTARLEQAYAPFESATLDKAVVFLPPTYGEWRNHPFQWLRNDPGFDGPAVYALDREPADDFAVVDDYPDRTLYRYRYHGLWSRDREVIPLLERLHRVDGESVSVRTTVAVPDRIVDLHVSVSDGRTVQRFDYVGELPDEFQLDWTVTRGGVTVNHPNLSSTGSSRSKAITGPRELVLTVTIAESDGGTLTYREALLVRPTDGGIQILWPPASTTCPLVTDCGMQGTYLHERPQTRPTGIAMNTTLLGGRG